MPRRFTHNEAAAIMAAVGYAVLVELPGSQRPWLSRCLVCGQESTPSLDGARKGHGCLRCATPKRVCAVEVCEETAKARGYCALHYWRWRIHGDPHTVKQPNAYATGTACSVEGCTSPVESRGWCSAHYRPQTTDSGTLTLLERQGRVHRVPVFRLGCAAYVVPTPRGHNA